MGVYDSMTDLVRYQLENSATSISPTFDYVTLDNYPESNLPTDPPTGSVFWNEDRSVPTYYDGDDYEVPVIGDDVNTSTATVENDATETNVWTGTLDAGSMKVGRVYEIMLTGVYSTNDGSDQFDLRIYIGDTEVADVKSVAANVSNAPIYVNQVFTVRSTGKVGEVFSHTIASFDNTHNDKHHGARTTNTLTATDLKATVEWGVAESGDVVNIGQAYMKEVA